MNKLFRIIAFVIVIFISANTAFAQGIGTIPQLQQFVATTSPVSGITQQSYGKSLILTGLTPGSNLCLDSNNRVTTTGCSSGGGGGTDGNWVFYNGSGIRLATTSNSVLIGASATSTNSKLEVQGTGGVISSFIQNGSWTGSEYALNVSGYSNLNSMRINGVDGQRALYQTVSGRELGFGTDAGDVSFSTDGAGLTRKVVIKATSGNVGIGTSTPQSKLVVAGSSISGIPVTAGTSLTLDSTGSDNYQTILSNSGNIAGLLFGNQNSALRGGVIYGNSDDSMRFLVNGNTERVRITSAGNVGIGTSTPSRKLEVVDSGVIAALTSTNSSSYLDLTNSSSVNLRAGVFQGVAGLAYGANTTAQLAINSSGNVGIGTTSPAATLSIQNLGSFTTLAVTGGGNQGTNDLFRVVELPGISQASFQVMSNANLSKIGFNRNGGGFTVSPLSGLFDKNLAENNNNGAGSGGSAIQIGESGISFATRLAGSGYTTLPSATKMFIDTAGNVGIATTSPAWRFQVAGTRPDLAISDSAGGTNLKHVLLSNRSGNLYIGTSTDVYATSTTPTLTLLANGNVGVGTAAPAVGFDAFGNGGVQLGYAASGDGILVQQNSTYVKSRNTGSIFFQNVNTTLGTFTNTGNLGIGTSSPTSVLHIAAASPTFTIERTGVTNFTVSNSGSNWTLGSTAGNHISIAPSGAEAIRVLNGGFVGVGTTTPYGMLSVNSVAGSPGFVVGSSTATSFIVDKNGNVGVGTANPTQKFMVSLGTNEIARFNDIGGSTSGIWGLNIGLLSQASEAQIVGASSRPLVFYTGGTINSMTAGTERMRIDTSGNIGIGTSTPQSKLEVYGGNITSGATDGTSGFAFRNAAGNANLFFARNINDTMYIGQNSAYSGIQFQPGANTTVTFLQNGNVGIGTTTPFGSLAVNAPAGQTSFVIGSSTATSFIVDKNGNVGIGTANPTIPLNVSYASNNTGTFSAALVGAQLVSTSAYNSVFSVSNQVTSALLGVNSSNSSAPNLPFIGTVNNSGFGFYTNAAERMRIDATGNLGIGTTSPMSMLAVAGTATVNNINATSTTATSVFSGIVQVLTRFITVISSAFTPTTEGEIGIDTTSNQLKYFSGGAVRVVAPDIETAFIMATSSLGTGTTTLKTAGYFRPTTYTKFGCNSMGSGTFVARLGDSNASSTSVVSATGLTTTFTTLSSNNSFTSGETVWYEIGSVSGTVINPTCGYTRTIDAD